LFQVLAELWAIHFNRSRIIVCFPSRTPKHIYLPASFRPIKELLASHDQKIVSQIPKQFPTSAFQISDVRTTKYPDFFMHRNSMNIIFKEKDKKAAKLVHPSDPHPTKRKK